MFLTSPRHRPRAWRSWLFAWACATLAAGLMVATAPARAAGVDCFQPLDVHLSYEVNHTLGAPITDIITFNRYAVCSGPGAWWVSEVGYNGSTIVDPFTKSSSNMPVQALMLGLTTNLPGDAPGQMHVVMMVDPDAALAAEDIAWGATFPSTLEDRIVGDLMLTMRSDRSLLSGEDADAWDAALGELFAFVTGEADAAGMWFDLPANPQPGTTSSSAFTVAAWSDGAIVGSGQALLTRDAAAAVPLPGTLALAGLGVLGLVRGRRAPRG